MKVGIIWILVLANLEKLKLWLIKALQAELQFENNPLAVLTRGFPCRQEMWSFRTRLRILIVFIERMVCSEKEDITEVSNSASGTRLTILITRCIPHHDTSASLEIWLCQSDNVSVTFITIRTLICLSGSGQRSGQTKKKQLQLKVFFNCVKTSWLLFVCYNFCI